MVIDFDVLLHPTQFISEAKYNTNASALIDLNMVHQFDQNIPRQLVDILILPERQQKRIFYVNTIFNFRLFCLEALNDCPQSIGLLLIICFHVAVIGV